MLPNDKETIDAVLAALNDASLSDLEKIAKVGVIYLKYLALQQLAELPPVPLNRKEVST
jgi:hypothetical protein